jgi:hypothetical protein
MESQALSHWLDLGTRRQYVGALIGNFAAKINNLNVHNGLSFSLVVALILPEVRQRRMVKGFDFIFFPYCVGHLHSIIPAFIPQYARAHKPFPSHHCRRGPLDRVLSDGLRLSADGPKTTTYANRDVPSDASPILWAATPSCRRYQTRLVVELVLWVVGALAHCGAGRLRRFQYLRLCRWMWLLDPKCAVFPRWQCR